MNDPEYTPDEREPDENRPDAVSDRLAWDYDFIVGACGCMTEDLGDGLGERVVTHSSSCPESPRAEGTR